MTTQLRSVPSAQEHDAQHDPAACCWLCAMPHEDRDWWQELRERRGLSKPPYEIRRWQALYRRARRRGL